MRLRGKISKCQRYSAKAAGCGRTATAVVGKRALVLRGLEYSRNVEAVCVSKGSVSTGVLLELESVYPITPSDDNSGTSSQQQPFKAHSMHLDSLTSHSGCVVGDLSYDNEELTQLLIPILAPESAMYDGLQRILPSLWR